MELTYKAVTAILKDCLFKNEELVDGKPTTEPIMVEGIVSRFGFNKGRLESHRQEVKDLLANLPKEFFKGTGDGYSTLNMCMTKDDVQWGEQINVDELCCLAIGLGIGQFILPRSMWIAFPGGMPYVCFEV